MTFGKLTAWPLELAWIVEHLTQYDVPNIKETRMQDGTVKRRPKTSPRKCLGGEITMTAKQAHELEEFADEALGQPIQVATPGTKEARIVAFAGKPQRLYQHSSNTGGGGMILRECTMKIELVIVQSRL